MKVDNITLMMFVLNFVEFSFILELIYSSDFHEGRQYFMLIHVDACVKFLKKLDHKYATIILYYYCDQPSSFSQAPSACRVQCSTERLVILVGGIGGRGGIKMASAKNNQLMSSQGPHFSPRSTAKTNVKRTNLRNNGIYWYK